MGEMERTERDLLVEQLVWKRKKSLGMAYLLWLMAGMIGGHRVYLNQMKGVYILMFFWFAGFWFPALWLIGLAALVADLFLMPSLVRAHMEDVRREYQL